MYVNPFSGARRARHIWERVAAPVFQRARVAVTVVETAKMVGTWHAARGRKLNGWLLGGNASCGLGLGRSCGWQRLCPGLRGVMGCA